MLTRCGGRDPGFARITTRRRNDVEEIDLVIRNESTDPFWAGEGSGYILVECKNWSSPVGALEYNHFRAKLADGSWLSDQLRRQPVDS